MVDFSSLLDARVGEAKEPKPLPPGDYPGIIKAWAPVEAPPGKEYKTMIRFTLGLMNWPDEVEQEDRMQEGKGGQLEPIDLAKRPMRRDFYDHRLFDLDKLLADLGIEAEGLSYKETLPRTIGQQVLVEVTQYMNSTTGKPANQVNNLRAAG